MNNNIPPQMDLFHVHTYRCGHASKEKDEDYILKAIQMGAASITFADHAPFPKNPFGSRMNIEQLDEYCATLAFLRQKYAEKINVGIALEAGSHPVFYGVDAHSTKELERIYKVI